MIVTPAEYARGYKRAAGRGLDRAGKSQSQFARDVGEHASLVKRWFDEDSINQFPGWVRAHPGCPTEVRVELDAYESEMRGEAPVRGAHTAEAQSNVVIGSMGSTLATMSSHMCDGRIDADEAAEQLRQLSALRAKIDAHEMRLRERVTSSGVMS